MIFFSSFLLRKTKHSKTLEVQAPHPDWRFWHRGVNTEPLMSRMAVTCYMHC